MNKIEENSLFSSMHHTVAPVCAAFYRC